MRIENERARSYQPAGRPARTLPEMPGGFVRGIRSGELSAVEAAEALILGKTNLSEWANFRSEHSMSGWSALGGIMARNLL